MDTFVQIDRITVSVDGVETGTLSADGRPVSIPLMPGRHRVEVVGAFRRCLFERCNGSWTFWRRAEAQIELRGSCRGAIRVDIYDESRPAGWPPEAPMMDLRQRTRCDGADPPVFIHAPHIASVPQVSSAPEADAQSAVDASSSEPIVEIGNASTTSAASDAGR